jgi:signal transduction histidine kinase
MPYAHENPLFAAVDEAWFALDAQLNIRAVLTRSALDLCTGAEPLDQPLKAILGPLLSGDDLAALLAAASRDAEVPRTLGAVAVALPRADGGAATRLCEPRLCPAPPPNHLLLGFRDVTEQLRQRAALEHAQSSAALARSVLAAEPKRLQRYLESAAISVALIKSLLQLPARDPAAFRQKLERILAEVLTLQGEAEALGLGAVAEGARTFEAAVAAVALRDGADGDEFLPLAARLNDLFSQLNAAMALVERHAPVSTGATAAVAVWHAACEARMRALAARLAHEHSRRVDLVIIGLEQVPAHLQGSVDGMLTHLVGNAVEHGIEPVEQRLAAAKRAAGTLTVQLAATDGRLELTVQDDGQGFDTSKLGRAAVARGILSEDTLQKTEARTLIGLIFRPGFSTAPISAPGRGLGMEFLRELVARLDGRINVATKSRQYTRFRIELPLRARAATRVSASRHAAQRALP